MLLQVHHDLHGLEVEHVSKVVNMGIFGIRAMRRGDRRTFRSNLTLLVLLEVHHGLHGLKVEHVVNIGNMGIFGIGAMRRGEWRIF